MPSTPKTPETPKTTTKKTPASSDRSHKNKNIDDSEGLQDNKEILASPTANRKRTRKTSPGNEDDTTSQGSSKKTKVKKEVIEDVNFGSILATEADADKDDEYV